MYIYQYGYRCEKCGFKMKAFICNRYISPEEAESILYNGKVILDGFSKKDGKIFSSIPTIDGITVVLDDTVCHCPVGGRIYVGSKWFRCDKRDHCRQPCFFTHAYGVRRSYDGHLLTIEEVRSLVYEKKLNFEVRDIEGNLSYRTLTLLARRIVLT